MKICVLTHTFPKNKKDTTAPFMHALSLGLKKAGHEIIVLIPYIRDLRKEDFPYKIVTYKYIWPEFFHILGYSQTLKNGSGLKLSTYLLFPFFSFFGTLALINLVRKEKINIISSHWILPNGFFALIAFLILKVPYIVSLPGSDVYLAKKNKIFAIFARITADNALAIIADSPRFLAEILSLGVKAKNTEIIPYPVTMEKKKSSLKEISRLRKKLNLKKDNLIILSVGRLVYKKGFDYLIKAMPLVIEKHSNIRLIIIGDGDLRGELENLVLKLNLSKYVKFVGNINRKDLVTYYNLSDIFVAPSVKDKEGNMDDQPVSLIEAMACGKPIVATNFPGIAMTVKNGVNGFLFPEKDINSLRLCLNKLIVSPKLRNKMGLESRKIVLNEITDKKIGERYSNLILASLKTSSYLL